MQTGREGVCRHAILKSCDKIPPAMSYRQMKRILPLYAKCQLSLRQILISILKMKAGVRTHECNFALDSFVGGGGWGGGGGPGTNSMYRLVQPKSQMGMVLEPFWSKNGC